MVDEFESKSHKPMLCGVFGGKMISVKSELRKPKDQPGRGGGKLRVEKHKENTQETKDTCSVGKQ